MKKFFLLSLFLFSINANAAKDLAQEPEIKCKALVNLALSKYTGLLEIESAKERAFNDAARWYVRSNTYAVTTDQKFKVSPETFDSAQQRAFSAEGELLTGALEKAGSRLASVDDTMSFLNKHFSNRYSALRCTAK